MKICYLIANYLPIIGGLERFVEDMANEYSKNGNEAIIFTKKIENTNSFEENENVRIYRSSIGILGNPKYVYSFIKMLMKEKPDIVHQIEPYTPLTILSFIAKYFFGCKIILTSGGTKTEFTSSKIIRILTAKISDKIIVCADYLSKYFFPKIFHKKIKKIEYGINLNEFIFNKNKEDNLILSVNRIVPRKNIDMVVKSLKYVKMKIPNIRYIIIGPINDLEYLHKIEEIIKEKNLQKNVKILGKVSRKELIKYYAKAKIFILPSKYEQFGIVFIEAMASGIPIITTNTSAMPDVVDGAGILLNQVNELEISNAIIKLLTDKKFYTEKKKEALKRSKFYEKDKMFKKYREVYRSL